MLGVSRQFKINFQFSKVQSMGQKCCNLDEKWYHIKFEEENAHAVHFFYEWRIASVSICAGVKKRTTLWYQQKGPPIIASIALQSDDAKENAL
jgi:hypothetical protein